MGSSSLPADVNFANLRPGLPEKNGIEGWSNLEAREREVKGMKMGKSNF